MARPPWCLPPAGTSRLTAVFAVYALALLCTLLTAGSVSDAVGRLPAILAAMVIQAASTAASLAANELAALVAAWALGGP